MEAIGIFTTHLPLRLVSRGRTGQPAGEGADAKMPNAEKAKMKIAVNVKRNFKK